MLNNRISWKKEPMILSVWNTTNVYIYILSKISARVECEKLIKRQTYIISVWHFINPLKICILQHNSYNLGIFFLVFNNNNLNITHEFLVFLEAIQNIQLFIY